ncbi:SLC13 family permease [Halosimplex sp. TS25]|uniref:SLC13 family permease n=1 Tax=Halosimplex rarum TaxID=3396619 RepID=UPI0039E73A49
MVSASVGQAVPPAGVTPEMLVVFAVTLAAVVLFVTEWLPIDVTAIAIMVTLIVLEPWTQISPTDGISGFSSPATITVLAMFILSAGISRTGAVQIVGRKIAAFAGDSLERQLLATIGVAGPLSGFVNNTPVVAILVPVISDVAHKGNTSPSKLLIPLSYASQLGGMLTLIGTSTNILASATSARLSRKYPSLHAFDFFEFTALGAVVLVVGGIYLVTIGHRLLPERVPPDVAVDEPGVKEYLAEVVVDDGSPLVGRRATTAVEASDVDADLLQLVRDGERFTDGLDQRRLRPDDTLLIRASSETLGGLDSVDGLVLPGAGEAVDAADRAATDDRSLVQVVVPSSSPLVGETLRSSPFRGRYDATVLALRTRSGAVRDRLDDFTIRGGDTLLVRASDGGVDRLARTRDFVLSRDVGDPDYRSEKIPHAIAIMIGVVGLVALPWELLATVLVGATGIQQLSVVAGFQQDILVSALAGVVAMVVAGVLGPGELYESVDWTIIFLLAGVIPLGVALERTGAAALVGSAVAASAGFLPDLLVLWVFYVTTGLITEVISNNASVVLMIPVAAAAATAIGANPFAFVLAVTFAASTAFLGPIGYQTNLFVYGPGGYRFTDYMRVGAPLQLLLSMVTVLGIALLWGL